MRALTLCLFVLVAGVLARSNETQATLSVQGSAELSVPPDQANVVFTTSVTEDSAREARQNAANVTNTVLAALGEIEGLNVTEDVRTVTINVSPKTVGFDPTIGAFVEPCALLAASCQLFCASAVGDRNVK